MHTITRDQFRTQCRFVAHSLGSLDEDAAVDARIGCHYDGLIKTAMVYRDDTVQIIADLSSMALCVDKLDNQNPVVSTDVHGNPVRDHGEQELLFDHVHALAVKSLDV